MSYQNKFDDFSNQIADTDWMDDLAVEDAENGSHARAIRAFLVKVQKSLKDQDPTFWGPTQRDRINTLIDKAVIGLANAQSHKTLAYILSLKSHIQAFNDSSAVNLLRLNENTRTVSKVISEVENFQNKQVEHLTKRHNDIEKQYDELKSKADTLSASCDATKKDFDEKHKATELAHIEKIDGSIKAIDQRFETDIVEPIQKRSKELESKMDELVAQSEGKRDEIIRLLKLAANDSVSGHFTVAARQNMRAAILWRWLTLFFMASGFAIVLWLVVGSSELTNSVILLRLSLLAALIPITTYSAFQSGRFRYQHERYSTTAMQLEALPAYLDDLPEERRSAILEKISDNLFVRSALHETKHSLADIPNSNIEKIQKLFS